MRARSFEVVTGNLSLSAPDVDGSAVCAMAGEESSRTSARRCRRASAAPLPQSELALAIGSSIASVSADGVSSEATGPTVASTVKAPASNDVRSILFIGFLPCQYADETIRWSG